MEEADLMFFINALDNFSQPKQNNLDFLYSVQNPEYSFAPQAIFSKSILFKKKKLGKSLQEVMFYCTELIYRNKQYEKSYGIEAFSNI